PGRPRFRPGCFWEYTAWLCVRRGADSGRPGLTRRETVKGRGLSSLAVGVLAASVLAVAAPGVRAASEGRHDTAYKRGSAAVQADERYRDMRNNDQHTGRYSGRSRYYGNRYRNNGSNATWRSSSRYSSDWYRRHHYRSSG